MQKGHVTTAFLAIGSLLVTCALLPVGKGLAENRKASPACSYSALSAKTHEQLCIRAGAYNGDICRAIESLARESNLPPDYFARLLWRESRFRPDAISPKGARGIAQFMPSTAALRGLADSTDALQAMEASAIYLDELRNKFGNLGLAAGAYNAGEQRLASFLSSGSLPFETQSYVYGITGHSAEEWKAANADLALPVLDDRRPFIEACTALAETRRLVQPALPSEGLWAPWGAQLAAAPRSEVARMLFKRATSKLPSPLASEEPLIIRKRDRDFGFRPRYSARIGRAKRADAEKACAVVMRAGLPCLVFKNF
ncbi:lytic transglycosylase domain-containing protein [Rhizobium sp. HT1-10]|uniref:lytic transglycosylase domain-containing protein n=1 Tax=Rhizobium sp. HT1-10 TaxID=3111638 RepID=UPI003C2AA11B